MTDFLVHTLGWTGVLIAAVLLLRRPVAAAFGAGAAYALWALPMARLLLPPLVLPAWLAPAPDPAATAGVAVSSLPMDAAVSGAGREPAAPIDWLAWLVAAWLIGAGVFLVRRYALYFRMRRQLLADARPVGEAGRVRLVETAATAGPVAFGVWDKVIALPRGFMATRDRTARDLALAHELAHHRGHDLLVNMLVQPLFALHWFNPLGRLGWQALRRDQEAACDARVIASAGRASRAAYAAVIAQYAAAVPSVGRLALAAPMACPVLGDRSIVQRIRGLAMSDIPRRRRRVGGVLIGAAALTLPLTASFSYAPQPAIPAVTPVQPTTPQPPTVAETPRVSVITTEREGGKRTVHIERHIDRTVDRVDGREVRSERRTYRKDGREMTADEITAFEKDMDEAGEVLDRELGENGTLHRELARELGAHGLNRAGHGREFGPEGAIAREVRLAVAEAGPAVAFARAAIAAAPRVSVRCRDGQREVSETVIGRDGRETIFVCQARAADKARRALAVARTEIARSKELSERQREEALRSLDIAERSLHSD